MMIAGSVWGQTTYTSTTDGNWSTMTWSPSGTPGSSDNVVIDDGHTVTIDQNISIVALTVGHGSSGILTFDGTSRTVSISGNITIQNGATFITQEVTSATHGMNIGGYVSNNGIFDMSRGGADFLCDVTFTKDGNQTVSGTGSTTRFNAITLNMGTSNTNILEITANNFSAKSAFLTITKGTFKLTSAVEVTASTGNFTISSNAGLWVNGGTITFGSSSGSLTVNGSLKVDAGVLNVGNTIGNSITISGSDASANITEGIVNISGRWVQSSGGGANISGGSVNISTAGQTNNASTATLQVPNGSPFIMSGGTIKILNANSGNGGDLKITNSSASLTNGTLIIGNGTNTIGNINLRSDVSINNLTIDAGTTSPFLSSDLTVSGTATINSGTLIVPADISLTVSGTLTNNAGSSGLLIESDENGTGSLINRTNGVNATVQRYLTKYDAAGDSQYHFISSPVSAQSIFTDLTDFYRYSEVTNYWINRTSTGNPEAFGDVNFVVGRGYLVANDANVTKVFTGSLNSYLTDSPLVLTGTNTPDKGDGWNLFGNPFPSAIDWDGVVKGDGMDNALYYYDASIENYKYYINLDGETGAVGSGSRYIPAMQGFMVHAKSSGTKTISIDNDDRVHQAQTVFYKAATATPVSLSLKVSAGDYEDVAFVHFNEGATTQFDGAYDAYKLSSYNTLVPMIYTQSSNNEDLAINGLPELTEELAIPVYFVPGTEGIQTLTANLEGLMSTVVYLKDNKTNTTQNLTQNPIYSFTATEGDNPDRFLLHFGIVGIEDNTSNLSQINAYAYQNQLYVQSNLNEARVSLFDIQGHQLLSREIDGAGSTRIPLDLPTGIYIVRLQSNNQVKNVKVFIN